MEDIKLDIQKIKKTTKNHTPDVLSSKGMLGVVATCMFVGSEEWKVMMKEKHPDWFKDKEL